MDLHRQALEWRLSLGASRPRKAKGICITGTRKEIRMTEAKTSGKAGRPSRSLDEEIAAVAARLQALRDKKKEEERRERERNQKAILALIKDEGLDAVSAEAWKAAVPKLRKLLVHDVQPDRQASAQLQNALSRATRDPVTLERFPQTNESDCFRQGMPKTSRREEVVPGCPSGDFLWATR